MWYPAGPWLRIACHVRLFGCRTGRIALEQRLERTKQAIHHLRLRVQRARAPGAKGGRRGRG